MKSIFTLLWCIKLNFDPNCVYFVSYILDICILVWLTPYGLGQRNWYDNWPQWIFFIASVVALLMAIFAVIQIITKSSSAGSRAASYTQARLYTILGLAIGGIILFILGMTYVKGSNEYRLRWALEFGSPLMLCAAALHSYHENFT